MRSSWPLLGSIRRILSRVTASGYIFRLTFRHYPTFSTLMSVGRKKVSVCQNNVAAFSCCCKILGVVFFQSYKNQVMAINIYGVLEVPQKMPFL